MFKPIPGIAVLKKSSKIFSKEPLGNFGKNHTRGTFTKKKQSDGFFKLIPEKNQ